MGNLKKLKQMGGDLGSGVIINGRLGANDLDNIGRSVGNWVLE